VNSRHFFKICWPLCRVPGMVFTLGCFKLPGNFMRIYPPWRLSPCWNAERKVAGGTSAAKRLKTL
jgi:hypothetical protein